MTDHIIGTCGVCHREICKCDYIDRCSIDDCDAIRHEECTMYCDECELPICAKHYAYNHEMGLCPTCMKKVISEDIENAFSKPIDGYITYMNLDVHYDKE